LFFHPLRKFPAPWLAAATKFPRLYYLVRGDALTWIGDLHRKHGPVVRVAPNELSFIESEAWKDIYGFRPTGKASLRKDQGQYSVVSILVPNLLDASDADHLRMRRAFSGAFSEKALKDQEPLFMKYGTLLVKKLREKTAADPMVKVNMIEMFNFTTFDIMGNASSAPTSYTSYKRITSNTIFELADLTFGEPLHMLKNSQYIPWVSTVFESIRGGATLQALSIFPAISIVIKVLLERFIHRKRLEHFQYSIDRVDRRLAIKTERPDIWTFVLRQEGDRALSLAEMHSNADVFMIAGTETTATLLSGLVYLLLRNPGPMRQLTDEIRESFNSPEEMTLGSLARLKYLHACLEEALRLYPPIPTGLQRRTPPGGTAICGKYVPENV
jgi:cytochrome P450